MNTKLGSNLAGIVAAMITPFNADESVDQEGVRVVARHLIDQGIHGLFPGGSQGEFYALTTEERKQVLELTLDAAAGDVFVVAHVGAITTREAIDLTRHAQASGADAVAAVTPFFVKPTQDELYRYFADICASTSLPVLAYDNVGRTNVPLATATISRLAHGIDNFVGVKDSSGDLTQLAEHIRLCPPAFRAFVGRDSLIYGALLYGGAGAVAATANVVPGLAVGIYEAVKAGELEKALQLQKKLAPVRMAFGLGTFPVVVKEAMHMLGLPAGPARRPVGALSDAMRAQLKTILEQVGVI
ncbi:MAG: 4-hydroxy-tetrahydrodipicolinate synthase [Anaerolineae bacterium]|nr:4-hydroxy-tetrahydrodipicolinate synthase [Anaerolineae bacterium]